MMLPNHKYTKIANTDKVIVWECKQPGTITERFFITIVNNEYMTICGDFGSWGFERNKLLNTLAGDNIWYIFSKLDHRQQKRVFEKKYLKEYVEEEGYEMDLLDCVEEDSSLGEVYSLLYDHNVDCAEWVLDKPDPKIIHVLELFNHAAKEILNGNTESI